MIKNGKEYMERFTSLIPLFSVLFLVYATLDTFFYFQLFNFNVLPFLEIAELLPLTLFDFIITIIFITGCLIWLMIIKHYFKRFFIVVLIIVGLGFAFAITYHIATKDYTNFVDSDCFFLSIFFSGVLVLYLKELAQLLPRVPQFVLTTCLIFILIIGNARFRAYNKFYDVMYTNHYLDTYIVTEKDKIIRSGPVYFYIGKCKSNYIFYNSKTRGVDLYPVDSVSKAYINSK